jgi:hypothetical protein
MNMHPIVGSTTSKGIIGTMHRGLRWMGLKVREKIELKIHLAYDPEASVWYVAESDIPGLNLEAEDPAQLMRKIADCAGEMIELNAAEIISSHNDRKERPMVTFRPVFDSAVPVPAYG